MHPHKLIADGRTAGGLYAGASAGHGVGASAALAGNVEADGGGAGGSIAEAHATGLQKSVVQTVESQPPQVVTVDAPVVHHQQPSLTVTKNVVATADAVPETSVGDTVVYHKIKTKKKFHTVPVQPAVVQQVRQFCNVIKKKYSIASVFAWMCFYLNTFSGFMLH